jgi:tetratricopeptide (TPR) repeat protein
MDLSTRQGRREQGQLIQKAVERAGLSVEELANRIGCSRALIYQYLSGTTLAQPDRLQQIAAETGVSLAYFYGGSEDRKGRRGGDREDAQARFDERIRQLEELANAQETPPDWGALASTCERIVSLASQFEDDPAEARALLRLGKARVRMGEFSRASDSLVRAAELFASLGDPIGEADARQTLGHAFLALGRAAEAKEQFEWVARSDRWGARWSGAVSLAAVYEQQGDYRRAMESCDEAAALLEEASDQTESARGMLYVNANRVNLYLACGDFKSAQVLAEKCLEEAEAQGNSDQHLEARLNLGFCAFHQGRWAVARRTLTSAVQLARFLGDKSRESMARATLAILLAALCDCDACISLAKDALAMALSQGDHRAELFAQIALADAYFTMGRDSEARYHANQALGVATALRLTLYEAEARLRTAALYLHNNELDDALEPVERALATANQLGARHIQARGLVLRGDYRFRTEDLDGARADALTAAGLARELGTTPVEWEAEALLARVGCAYEPMRLEEADDAVARAVALVEQVRTDLRDAGIADTLLEDKGRQEIYLLRAKLLADSGRPDEATAFIEQAAWPPLSARSRGKRRAQ